MRKRWHICVLAMVLAITGFALLGRPGIARAAGPDDGVVTVYVYHDVNEDGVWNWGEVAPPNMKGDHAWQWDYPCTHPSTACEMAEIGLVGAHVALTYHGGETRLGETFHDGPARFFVPVDTQVVGVDFLGTDDGRPWKVTHVSQKTVNEPAAGQFEFTFPLPPAGPNSMHVLLVGVAESDQVVHTVYEQVFHPVPVTEAAVAAKAPVAAKIPVAAKAAVAAPVAVAPEDTGQKPGAVSVYVYHDVNEDGVWNWGEVAPPNMKGDHAWQWDYSCTHPSTAREMPEIGLAGAHVALTYHGGEIHFGETFYDGPAQFAVPVGTQVVEVGFLGTDDCWPWKVTNVSQKTVNEPAAGQFEFDLPLPPAALNSMHVLLVGVAEDCWLNTGPWLPFPEIYTIQPGDTLGGIARAFGTTVEALASANGIANPDLIYAGAVIAIP